MESGRVATILRSQGMKEGMKKSFRSTYHTGLVIIASMQKDPSDQILSSPQKSHKRVRFVPT